MSLFRRRARDDEKIRQEQQQLQKIQSRHTNNLRKFVQLHNAFIAATQKRNALVTKRESQKTVKDVAKAMDKHLAQKVAKLESKQAELQQLKRTLGSIHDLGLQQEQQRALRQRFKNLQQQVSRLRTAAADPYGILL
jgi:hypothetical protein